MPLKKAQYLQILRPTQPQEVSTRMVTSLNNKQRKRTHTALGGKTAKKLQ